jgi:hypothetical protein
MQLVEGAHELSLENVTFPANRTGSMILKACSTCDALTRRVDLETTYSTSAGPMPLAEFLIVIDELDDAPGISAGTPVTVFYSLSSGRVTRVIVHDNRDPT